MDKRTTILQVYEVVTNSQTTPEELCTLLEVTVEDLLRKFPRKLLEHAEKFGVYPDEEEEKEGDGTDVSDD